MCGKIENETAVLVPDLLRIHDFGCLSFESQPALVDGPGKKEPLCSGGPHAFWYSKQKAFLSFLLPKKKHIKPALLKEFCEKLIADERFSTSILTYDRFCAHGKCQNDPSYSFHQEDSANTFPQAAASWLQRSRTIFPKSGRLTFVHTPQPASCSRRRSASRNSTVSTSNRGALGGFSVGRATRSRLCMRLSR